MLRGSLLLALVAMGSACGPIEYITTITFQAQKAIDQAKAANAPEYAPYEWTLAEEHLMKARELGGYARFQEAVDYGKTAIKYGREAESVALEKDKRVVPTAVPPTPQPQKPSEKDDL